MKVIACVVLALIGAVYSKPTIDGDMSGHVNADALRAQLQSSCPGRCLMQEKYQDAMRGATMGLGISLQQMAQKAQTEPQTQTANIPPVSAAQFDKGCTEITAIKTCVAACNDAADAEKKQKATAILDSIKDLICDADIKNKFSCLTELVKIPSPQCDTQCEQFGTKVKQQLEPANMAQPDWTKAKEGAKATCQFINCRVKCRKTDIVNKCEQSGYDAAKKTVQKLATVAKTVHATFRPAENFPAECNPDQVIQGA